MNISPYFSSFFMRGESLGTRQSVKEVEYHQFRKKKVYFASLTETVFLREFDVIDDVMRSFVYGKSMWLVMSSLLSQVVDIACGSLHCVVCTEAGKVYSWGDNDEGQIGNDTTSAVQGPQVRGREISGRGFRGGDQWVGF